MGWVFGITNSMHMNLSKLQRIMKDREACVLQSLGSHRVGHDLTTEHNPQTEHECNEMRKT